MVADGCIAEECGSAKGLRGSVGDIGRLPARSNLNATLYLWHFEKSRKRPGGPPAVRGGNKGSLSSEKRGLLRPNRRGLDYGGRRLMARNWRYRRPTLGSPSQRRVNERNGGERVICCRQKARYVSGQRIGYLLETGQ